MLALYGPRAGWACVTVVHSAKQEAEPGVGTMVVCKRVRRTQILGGAAEHASSTLRWSVDVSAPSQTGRRMGQWVQ